MKQFYHIIHHIILCRSVNRNTTQFSEKKAKGPSKQFLFAKKPGMLNTQFASESQADKKIPVTGMGANNQH